MMRRSPVVCVLFAAVLLAIACGYGGGSGDEPTPEASGTPAATASPTSDGAPTASPTASGFTNARQALDAYIRDQLSEENIGACPTSMVPGQQGGICSTLLYESAELTTFALGVPFSEGIGELVLTRDAAGQVWTVTFVPAPVLGEELAVGKKAVVFGAGDCLNFRNSPNPDAPVNICAIDGTTGNVFGGPLLVQGITWWQVGDLGWATGEFLAVAAE